MPTKEEILKADRAHRKMRKAETKDYLEDGIYRAPDTGAGKASLKRRRKA